MRLIGSAVNLSSLVLSGNWRWYVFVGRASITTVPTVDRSIMQANRSVTYLLKARQDYGVQYYKAHRTG